MTRKSVPSYATPRAIIDAFGGYKVVAALVSVSRTAVSNWYRAGIPAKYHYALVREAGRQKIAGITHDVIQAVSANAKQELAASHRHRPRKAA